jgi:hypothetical protein
MSVTEAKLLQVMKIIFTIVLVLAIGYFATGKNIMEDNFDTRSYKTVDSTYPIPKDNLIPPTYYRIDETRMATLPYNNYVGPMPYNNKIPYGYYIVTMPNDIGDRMAKIPSGYAIDETSNNRKIFPKTQTAIYEESKPDKDLPAGKKVHKDPVLQPVTPDEKSAYKMDDYNVQYHDNITDMNTQMGINKTPLTSTYVYDKDGNRIILPSVGNQPSPTYYSPGSFIFGSTGYVPNYEDSVYLSKTTGLSTLKMIAPTSSMKGGFCRQYQTSPLQLEQKCNSIDNMTCASTDCCVLFGGSKCVSGNEKGPYMKSNFTDPTIVNKDVYYFKGNCYGNCN